MSLGGKGPKRHTCEEVSQEAKPLYDWGSCVYKCPMCWTTIVQGGERLRACSADVTQ